MSIQNVMVLNLFEHLDQNIVLLDENSLVNVCQLNAQKLILLLLQYGLNQQLVVIIYNR